MLNGKKFEIKVGGEFPLLPVDKYTTQILDVNPITQYNSFKGEEQEMLEYKFAVLDEKEIPNTENSKGQTTRGKFIWKRVTPSWGEKSWLTKLIKAVESHDLTKDEVKKYDLESLVGKQVDIMIEHNPSKKDPSMVFANIISFSKTAKKLEPLSEGEVKANVVVKSSVPVNAPASSKDVEEIFK